MHVAGVDEPLVWYEGATVSSTTRRYLHANHQGSIIATTNAAGAKLDRGTYDAYGVTNAPSIWRFQYTGQAAIPQLGLYYYKARFYNPALGRFMQTDPIGYEDDNNLYAYVGSDPLNRTDPTGLCTGSRITNDDGTCSGTGGNTTGLNGVAEGAARERAEASETLVRSMALAGAAVVSDGPLPIGDAVGAAIVLGAVAHLEYQTPGSLMDKMAREIDRIVERPPGPEAEQYSLRAMSDGDYPSVRGGTVFLNSGDVWKYGQTTRPNDRYSPAELATLNVRYVREFRGSRTMALVNEKMKLYGYFLERGALPPGNKIFR